MIEEIHDGARTLALILRATYRPAATCFPTPESFNLQVGFIIYPGGGMVPRHVHRPLHREISTTSEVIMVRSGKCVVDLFSPEKQLVASRELGPGDVILLVAGGHGFRMLEDTVLMEVKQGPYVGVDEKERF
jgi:hypothetical protein